MLVSYFRSFKTRSKPHFWNLFVWESKPSYPLNLQYLFLVLQVPLDSTWNLSLLRHCWNLGSLPHFFYPSIEITIKILVVSSSTQITFKIWILGLHKRARDTYFEGWKSLLKLVQLASKKQPFCSNTTTKLISNLSCTQYLAIVPWESVGSFVISGLLIVLESGSLTSIFKPFTLLSWKKNQLISLTIALVLLFKQLNNFSTHFYPRK